MNQPVTAKQHPDLGPDPMPDALRDLGYGPDGVPLTGVLPDHVPTMPPAAPKPAEEVEELDLLRYTALHERFVRQHLEMELHKVRLNEMHSKAMETGAELGKLLDTLGAKYNTDFHTHKIQPDGRIVPNKQ